MSAAAPSVLAFLSDLPLFAGVGADDLAGLVASGTERTIQPGEVLLREGEPGAALYIVLSGELEVAKQSGGSEVVIARRGPGQVIGEMSLLDHAPRSATVRALTATRLLEVGQEAFDALLARSPDAVRAVLATVTSRLRNTEAMLHQSEKMAALGTLSAGIAHELNNPAAAAGRAAAQLRDTLREAERWEFALSARLLEPAARADFDAWRSRFDSREPAAARLDPLARADLESAVQAWLEAHSLEKAWEVAPRLVEIGLDPASLDELARQFDAQQLPTLLEWLAARGSVASLLDEIVSSAERISIIVKAIKSYSYLDQAPVQEVDVHTGLENTLVILRHKLKQGITVQREYARDLPRIEAYASELNQVWTNIIDNAIDAMQGQGVLTIRTSAEGERVVVEICDTGPGIPPEVQSHIFEPFFTTKPIGSGTGLGLHISYNIVVLKQQGQITVHSQPGSTCFQVALPVRLRTK